VRNAVGDLYPSGGASVIADETVLRFTAPPGARRVEVEDSAGARVFESSIETDAVPVPVGVLKPGAPYRWRLKLVLPTGVSVQAEAGFSTLAAQDVTSRAALKKAAQSAGDAAALALLGEIDRGLGLLWEARDEFRAAVAKSPGDPALGAALADVERRLGGGASTGGVR
jgi:hypothetical protein